MDDYYVGKRDKIIIQNHLKSIVFEGDSTLHFNNFQLLMWTKIQNCDHRNMNAINF